MQLLMMAQGCMNALCSTQEETCSVDTLPDMDSGRSEHTVTPLSGFTCGQEGEIAYIQTTDNRKMQKLMAMGLLPGNRITLTHSFPSYIFRVGFSEFAIDTPLAREIFVRRP